MPPPASLIPGKEDAACGAAQFHKIFEAVFRCGERAGKGQSSVVHKEGIADKAHVPGRDTRSTELSNLLAVLHSDHAVEANLADHGPRPPDLAIAPDKEIANHRWRVGLINVKDAEAILAVGMRLVARGTRALGMLMGCTSGVLTEVPVADISGRTHRPYRRAGHGVVLDDVIHAPETIQKPAGVWSVFSRFIEGIVLMARLCSTRLCSSGPSSIKNVCPITCAVCLCLWALVCRKKL